jgi:hypothetical protein
MSGVASGRTWREWQPSGLSPSEHTRVVFGERLAGLVAVGMLSQFFEEAGGVVTTVSWRARLSLVRSSVRR